MAPSAQGDSPCINDFMKAALCIQEAVHLRSVPERLVNDETCTKSAFMFYKITHSPSYRIFRALVVCIILLAVIWEKPSDYASNYHEFDDDVRLPIAGAELALSFLLVVDICIRLHHFGGSFHWYHTPWMQAQSAILFLNIISVVTNMKDPASFRLHRVLRPLLLLTIVRNARKEAQSMFHSFIAVMKVCMLQIFMMVFFATFGFVLFDGYSFDGNAGDAPGDFDGRDMQHQPFCTRGGDPSVHLKHRTSPLPYCSVWTLQCTDYFTSLEESAMQLFIMLTTANFPDVMLPAFTCDGYVASAFAITFVVVSGDAACVGLFLCVVSAALLLCWQVSIIFVMLYSHRTPTTPLLHCRCRLFLS
jgi:two pore calcium channel protein 1